MTVALEALVSPPPEGKYQRYTHRSLCRRCPPQRRRIAENEFGLCENCRVAFCHKRKELKQKGQELTVEQFLRDFPLKQRLYLCKRCPKELERFAFSSGLCRDCSNAWTNLKAKLRKRNPKAVLPTAREFIKYYPKKVVKINGKHIRLVPRSPL